MTSALSNGMCVWCWSTADGEDDMIFVKAAHRSLARNMVLVSLFPPHTCANHLCLHASPASLIHLEPSTSACLTQHRWFKGPVQDAHPLAKRGKGTRFAHFKPLRPRTNSLTIVCNFWFRPRRIFLRMTWSQHGRPQCPAPSHLDLRNSKQTYEEYRSLDC